jgi:hypothetical protein
MKTLSTLVFAAVIGAAGDALASGHGPVFGAATPTLGRGGWSLDQAFTLRRGEDGGREQMFKTMVSFGVTEVVQVSASVPLVMTGTALTPARMMSPMSSDREFEGLLAYRFQRKPVGIGGRRESTLYVGGTVPFDDDRAGVSPGPSIVIGVSTGYASRVHYLWAGGALQHYQPRNDTRLGASYLVTFVYGYRPPVFRAEEGKPDLRFFVEATAEERGGDRVGTIDGASSRTVFVGPTTLLVYKAIAVEAGVLFPAHQRDGAAPLERARVAVNVAYFFWLK